MKNNFNFALPLIALIFASCLFSCSQKRSGTPKLLVFSKTAGYHHESVADGNTAIQRLGLEHGYEVDTTTDATRFNDDSLQQYSAVVFLSTTGDVLNNFQEAAFERYIQAGGGYVGVHAAADCEYDWGWYGRLCGGYFLSHPGINDTFPNVQKGIFTVVDSSNPATGKLPATWERTDEFYSFKKLSKETKVLLTIDEKSYRGGANGDYHPMTWYHDYDGGRAFYTALGHTKESFSDERYLGHLWGGIEYAVGENSKLDYTKSHTSIPPEDNRFTKTQLSQGEFFEPTEMTVLPNLDILIAQRRGEILLYKNETKKVKQVGFLKAYFKATVPGVNAEEGVLGLAKDPNFAKNNYIYIFYSPADTSVNRLSRFTFKNDTIDNATEKVILDVWSQREICCHTGGSIAFGPDGLLYLSAGDNSTPFDERGQRYVNAGFAPLNDEPGHLQYDARRSSGNTNDLRGKIMRIRIKDDGSYEIPEGNLFPKGTEKTRPEIYVMGNRNPYRISVDQKNSYLYWGEVGPDAQNDSMATRGPRGYDEVNQARKAGFFGWPLFIGNNYPYRNFNYATGVSSAAFDAAKPLNESRNNTGLKDLPPSQPAFIWYPYAASPDFPQVGTGGRNAMAGPVYYTDMFPKETRLPDYYNGKLFIYEWIRGWIKAVTLQPNGDFDKMEPFFGSIKLNSLIDMEVGPDGKLYLLEYGNGWFAKNVDAGLARIDFNPGNRAPIISSVTVDKTTGILPFAVNVKAIAEDPEKEKVTYRWNFGNGIIKESQTPEINFTYTSAGDYKISLTVFDEHGDSSSGKSLAVYAGNETPVVSINIAGGNKSFYIPGLPVQYAVSVVDKNDPAIDPANLFVSVDYPEGFDQAGSNFGHQQGVASISGKSVMLSLDCKACHKESEKSIGPSFLQVSTRYAKDPNAVGYLTDKIIKGGSGVWGEVAMAAHPNLTQDDAKQIVAYIMSLGNPAAAKKTLPATGTIVPASSTKPGAALVVSASYTDKGGNNIKALTGSTSAALRSNTFDFRKAEHLIGFARWGNSLILPAAEGSFNFEDIDLTGVHSIAANVRWRDAIAPFTIEVRLDSPEGILLGKGTMAASKPGEKTGVIKIPIQDIKDGKMHSVYFVYKAVNKQQGAIVSVQFNAK